MRSASASKGEDGAGCIIEPYCSRTLCRASWLTLGVKAACCFGLRGARGLARVLGEMYRWPWKGVRFKYHADTFVGLSGIAGGGHRYAGEDRYMA